MSETLRILLWDIDGTLMRSRQPGSFLQYVGPALQGVFGTVGRLAEIAVSGMTDLQIVGEALRDEGFTHEQIRARVGRLRELCATEIARATAAGLFVFDLLDGVRETLEALDQHPRYCSALLTGNLEPLAQFKLRHHGLEHFFTLPGAFGDDSHDRRDLPAMAAQRIEKALGTTLRPEQYIILGDTPNDIAAARHFGARAVAVATGRNHPPETLAPHNPDAMLASLSDPAQVLATLARL